MNKKSIHGKEHKVQFKPLDLIQQGPSSYLVEQFANGDILHFALHRLLKVTMSAMIFESHAFNLKDDVESQQFGFADRRKIRVNFTHSYRYRWNLNSNAIING